MSGNHHQDLMHGFHFLPVEYVHQMFLHVMRIRKYVISYKEKARTAGSGHTGVLDDSYGGFQRLEPLPKLQNMSWFLPSPPGNRAWFGTASDEQSLF